MPGWSLQSVRRLSRSFGVWLAWVVITGHLSHGKSYGELKRVERSAVAKQLVLIVLSVSVLGYFVTNIPAGPAFWLGSALLIGTTASGILVGGYFAITKYVTYTSSR